MGETTLETYAGWERLEVALPERSTLYAPAPSEVGTAWEKA